MKRYHAVSHNGHELDYEVEGESVFLMNDYGGRVDVTLFMLSGSKFERAEDALIDLYTDDGTGEGVSITEVPNSELSTN